MEEEVQPSLMAASFNKNKKNTSSSPQIRFLGFFNEQDSDSNPFELEESDVIWSPDLSDYQDSSNLDSLESNSPSTQSNSPILGHHSFRSDKFGLSAALSDDHLSLVQRKPSFNSSARLIPAVSNPRSGSSSPDVSGGSYRRKLKFHQSAPVNVPVWHKAKAKANGVNGSAILGFFEEEDEETEEEMLPPHEIVARSHSTTFSVFEGAGRTLKGRDLRRVRNAVWQQTGFLD